MPALTTTRNAVALTFALNGLMFATLVSRLPDVRAGLDISNSQLGLLLLSGSGAAVVALTTSGRLLRRYGAAAVVRGGVLLMASGLVLVAAGATAFGWVVLAVLGLALQGVGTSIWDVAMNVEGAVVERRLDRSIMPRFHAAWSAGSIAGAGLGVPMTAAGVPMTVHLGVVSAAALAAILWSVRSFLPAEPEPEAEKQVSAWREPRTLAIGVMVLAFATVEGSAYDWLTLAVIDGYDVEHWVGTVAFATFVIAMFVGRIVGVKVLDRFGRTGTLWGCCAAAFAGTLLTVFGGSLAVALLGIVVWGLGASLGFPTGMSAAADDESRAAARVSAVATIGYGAFLVGPPLLGALADQVGTLKSLLAVAALMIPAALTVIAAKPVREPAPAAG